MAIVTDQKWEDLTVLSQPKAFEKFQSNASHIAYALELVSTGTARKPEPINPKANKTIATP